MDVDERTFCEGLIELTGVAPRHDPDLRHRYERQFEQFLEGRLRRFDEPLDFLEGTAFERRVWRAMRRIPWGTTRSYKWLAESAGRPLAARAVGQANRKNPVALLLPCHRVINADGSLGGYGGRPELKRALLAREGVLITKRQASWGP